MNNSDGLIRYLYFIYFEKTTNFKGFYFDRQTGEQTYSVRDEEELYKLNESVLEKFESYIFND